MTKKKKESKPHHVVQQSRGSAAIGGAETIAGRAPVEIIFAEREVAGLAAVAEFPGDVRLAETVALAVVGWQDSTGVARTRHAVGELLIACRALVTHVARIAWLALAGTCYLEHDQCL